MRHEDIWAPVARTEPVVPYEHAGVLRRGCLEERWVDVFSLGRPNTRSRPYGKPAPTCADPPPWKNATKYSLAS
jgi:hypothetical protein